MTEGRVAWLRPEVIGLALLALATAGGAYWVLAGGAGETPTGSTATAGGSGAPTPSAAGTGPAHRTTFPPIAVPDSIVAAWADERTALPAELDAAALDVIRTWSIANFVAASAQLGRFEGDPQESARAHDDAIGRFLTARDPSQYRSLSWSAFDRFAAGLGTLETLEASGGLRDALADLSSPAVQAHYEACGDFVSQGIRSGVLSDAGELQVSPELLTVIFRYRWFASARGHRALSELMPGPESLLFQRWRIEQATGIPETDRLRYIAQLFREFPEFDLYTPDEARAIVTGTSGP